MSTKALESKKKALFVLLSLCCQRFCSEVAELALCTALCAAHGGYWLTLLFSKSPLSRGRLCGRNATWHDTTLKATQLWHTRRCRTRRAQNFYGHFWVIWFDWNEKCRSGDDFILEFYPKRFIKSFFLSFILKRISGNYWLYGIRKKIIYIYISFLMILKGINAKKYIYKILLLKNIISLFL